MNEASIELWEPLTEATLLPLEATTLVGLLREALRSHANVVTAIGYTDESKTATAGVYSVAVVDTAGVIIGSVYAHPGRHVVAMFKRSGQPAAAPDKDAVVNDHIEQFLAAQTPAQ